MGSMPTISEHAKQQPTTKAGPRKFQWMTKAVFKLGLESCRIRL